jgi:putative addiction module killer protein
LEYEILVYQTSRGKAPFSKWLEGLKDVQGRTKVRLRIERLAMGNFGDCKNLGDGVSELRIDFGPGYRVYFSKVGRVCMLLLAGGSKRTQVSDIAAAKAYFEDYKARRD